MSNHSVHIDNQSKKVSKLIKRFSPFLKKFHYDGFRENKGMNLWTFTLKFPDYTFRIIFGEKNDKWKAKIFVYWKAVTSTPTLGAGKDFEHIIGPYNNILELIKSIGKKLENNPIMGEHLYNDDSKLNMDAEAMPLLKKLKKYGKKLESINDVHFNDLKRIYKHIKNLPEDKLLDYCRIKNQDEADKQGFLLDLQKVNKIDFYLAMGNMGHIDK